MTLKQCTKAELLLVIKYLPEYMLCSNFDYYVQRALLQVEHDKEIKRIEEAEAWNKKSSDYRGKYIELLKPYEGQKVTAVPIDVIKKAEKYLKMAQDADKKYEKLMGY